MHVLFVSRWFPYPPIHGSKQRVYALLRALSAAHEVTLLSFRDDPADAPDADEIRSLCARIETVPWRPYRPRSVTALARLWTSTPRSIADTYSTEMAERVERACASGDHAVVVASQLASASYHARFAGLPAIFEEIELGIYADRARRSAAPLARGRHTLTWLKLRRYLADVLRTMDGCTVVSDAEATLLRGAVDQLPALAIVPNGTTLPAEVPPLAHRPPDELIFAGALTYAANADAIEWFVRAAYPAIKARHRGARLTVTGPSGGRRLRGDGVVQTGHVPDARPLVAHARVSIAPLRWGGGTRLKILEAMALGTPVVATSKAAEGLAVRHDEHCLIADDPREFAQRVVQLLDDITLAQRLADNARRLVTERYQWDAIGRGFVRFVEDVARAGHRPR